MKINNTLKLNNYINLVSKIKSYFVQIIFMDKFIYLVFCLPILISIFIYFLLLNISVVSDNNNFLSNFFLLSILIIIILIYFVGKQIIKLWAERRKKMIGSQLHFRLIILFAGLSAVPAIFLSIFAAAVLDFSLRGWFSSKISTAISESVQVAEAYFDEHSRSVKGQILTMANDINREGPKLIGNKIKFNEYLSNQTFLRNLSEAIIIDGTGQILAKSQFAFSISFSSIDDVLTDPAIKGDVVLLTTADQNKLQAIVKLNSFVDAYLLVSRFVESEVLSAVDKTKLAASDYQSLSLKQFDIKISLALMFFVFALLLIFSSLWIGLNLANSIVDPLIGLISVANQVRVGDLDIRVKEKKDTDEIAKLGNSFNRMLDELSGSRKQLVRANQQLDSRREFIEAVLGGVSTGVIGLNNDGIITLPNQTACDLFSLTKDKMIGKNLSKLIPEFSPLLDKLSENITEHQININRSEITQILRTRVSVQKIEGRIIGYVVTFDDITDFLLAQKKAAWSDVARRIAHEIKNPLTPIELATNRLKKKYCPKNTEKAKDFEEYLKIINRQVADIGRMVNEFSNFARMPAPNFKKINLVELINEQIALFSTDKRFKIIFKNTLKNTFINVDSGLLRQAILNIIKNSIEVLLENKIKNPNIGIKLSELKDEVLIEICDNGPGFPNMDLNKLLEPYITTREKGSGLGLAIVQKIVSDHGGQIILQNKKDNGAKTLLIFPKAME